MNRSSRVVVFLLGLTLSFSLGLKGSEAADKDGWRELFNGKDLTGWQNASGNEPGAGWVVEDGAMVRKNRAGDVWTKDRFGDFVLDLEFKTEGNSGIFIRTDNPRDCVQTGIEVAIDRPASKPGKHTPGALYDLLAPGKEMTKAGEWNHLVITAIDNKITIEINGGQIVDADLNQWTQAHKNPDGSRNKFRTALKDFKREGHIGIQDHGARISCRKIRIKPLDK